MELVWEFYNGQLSPDDELKRAILEEQGYFNQFGDFQTFLTENFLGAFFDAEGYLIRLSDIETYEEYVKVSNQIIQERSEDILSYLIGKKVKIENQREPKVYQTQKEIDLITLDEIESDVKKVANINQYYSQRYSELDNLGKLELTRKIKVWYLVGIIIAAELVPSWHLMNLLVFIFWIALLYYLYERFIKPYFVNRKYDKLRNELKLEHEISLKNVSGQLSERYFTFPKEFRNVPSIHEIRDLIQNDIMGNLGQALQFYNLKYQNEQIQMQLQNQISELKSSNEKLRSELKHTSKESLKENKKLNNQLEKMYDDYKYNRDLW